MRSRLHIVQPPLGGALAEDIRRLFLEISRTLGPDVPPGECAPPIDVLESDNAVTVVVDVPGIAPTAVRAIAKGDLLLVAGEKRPLTANPHATFHLVERGFGRFVRTVTLTSACDTARARATISGGELRIVIPKLADRRGALREIPIQVTGNAERQ